MPTGEIFFEHERWGHNLAWSAALHVGITVAIIAYAFIAHSGHANDWGAPGGGSAMGVSLVSNIPLPANPVQTQSVLATESKGVSKSEPKPAIEEPEAIAIPEKNAKKKPIRQPTETLRKPQPEPQQEASNVVPFGEGGPAKSFSAGGATGGIGITGAGDFGSRYGWYVQIIEQKTQQSWLAYEVDRRITQAPKVYITFDILRDGRPANARVEQSSGFPSLDNSAVNAIRRISTFGPLPADYAGSKVSVEWYFDYTKR
jgi:periplasmic protein TonB